jgi:DNA-binding transcriptional regulator GbsR (MarR family)
MTAAQPERSTDPRSHERAVGLVAEAIGDLMEFWSFKPSMGRVWAVLYLSQEPLSAEDICARTGLSSGSVSMTLNELRLWGVVGRSRAEQPRGSRRRRLYEAETDILSMVTRVFRERELKQVRRVVANLEEAARLMEAEGGSSDPSTMLRSRFILTRVLKLLELARKGESILEHFASAGELDLKPIRNWLAPRQGPRR